MSGSDDAEGNAPPKMSPPRMTPPKMTPPKMTPPKMTPPKMTLPDATDPAAALPAVVALRAAADDLEYAAVAQAVDQGWTWTAIAQALGVTRQAVHKRHAKRMTRPRGKDQR